MVATADTADSGSVTVLTVTIRGHVAGASYLTLSVNALGDEDGDSYDVSGVTDGSLTVGKEDSDNGDDSDGDPGDGDDSDGDDGNADDGDREKDRDENGGGDDDEDDSDDDSGGDDGDSDDGNNDGSDDGDDEEDLLTTDTELRASEFGVRFSHSDFPIFDFV
ncbi:hypothetical protein SAMN05421858_0430 [Haladaptatus litoreus]|uniref:Uncharacterized protein n=1 Tax=Haladaptatus litoreus TaxID=553468 RepID=A0A1N6VP70_9EURY|nr:hypothetical protein [Haladaptatus litoreus]SIQ79630.1 hypothetical protein SAMN05421858_0430 [Haladaptatus litoreus]